MNRRRTAIVNGKTADEPDVRAALDLLVGDGVPTEVAVTRPGEDATTLARRAAASGADEIVVFGGDGTLSGVANGLLWGNKSDGGFAGTLGIVPTGTANDFASAAGLVSDDPSAAVAALPSMVPTPVDVGRGDSGHFLNTVTAGFGSEISSEVSKELKDVLGRVAYLAAAVANVGEVEPRIARVRGQDFDRELGFYLLAIGNGRRAGGGIPVCPDASPVDGLFDVTIIPEGMVPGTIAEVVTQGLSGLGDAGLRFRTPWIELESGTPLQVNLDGEAQEGLRFRFEVRPRALYVLLPLDSPFFADGDDTT